MARESTEQARDRAGTPRVRITYDMEMADATETRELPFVVAVLADLSGRATPSPELKDRRLIEINRDNFSDELKAMHTCLAFEVPNRLTDGEPTLAVRLDIRHLRDFEPSRVAEQVEPLRRLLETRRQLSELGGRVSDAEQSDTAAGERITAIDRLLSRQLDEVMHAPEFQMIEASWRGLYYLVSQTATSTLLKIRVLNVSKEGLWNDLHGSVQFERSALFNKLYENVYGTEPIGALVGDYEFGNQPQDTELLERLSNLAAAAHVPFIAAASPHMFGFESFAELDNARDLSRIFATPEYALWNSFRDSEDARYVALTLPRVLMRLPYGTASSRVETFDYREHVEEHRNYTWGNAAYAFGACVTNAFAKYSWFAAIRGPEGGGLVKGLPTHTFKSDDGNLAAKGPAETAISARREHELSDLGFVPLIQGKGRDDAAFFSPQSCCRPKRYDHPDASASSVLSTQLQYVLITSRFAHYLKAIMREKEGRFASREECERFLNQWISRYVVSDDTASLAMKAARPLREAKVDVREVPGRPAIYEAAVSMRPHFQFEGLGVTVRSVVELATGVTPELEQGKAGVVGPSEVANEPTADGGQLAVDPRFKSLKDFEPERVAQQVEFLRNLLDIRQHLTSARASVSEAPPEAVLLGASAPVAVRPGEEFTARFVAYVKGLELQVKETLENLGARNRVHLGLKECHWKPGARVTVVLRGQHLEVEESEQQFEWNGTHHLADFDVRVDPDAPEETVVLKYDVYMNAIRLAKLRIYLQISRTAKAANVQRVAAKPVRSAFASYASADGPRVLDRVAAVRTAAGLDIFLDCLSLHPGDEWKTQLRQEIVNRDIFLLFWSKRAIQSPWVEWEWRTALAEKGEKTFQFHPLDPVEEAPPPSELRHLHFNDPLMMMRRAYDRQPQ